MDLAPRLGKLEAIRSMRDALTCVFDASIDETEDFARLEGHVTGSRGSREAEGNMKDSPVRDEGEDRASAAEEVLRRGMGGFMEEMSRVLMDYLEELERRSAGTP